MPFAENGPTRIHYDVEGVGDDVLVFLPGLGLPGQAFSLVRPAFRERFLTIAIDPRGAGESDKPDTAYTPEIVVADLVAVLDAVGVDSAHVMGLSMGGMIGQNAALLEPERVRSLALISSYGAVDAWSGRCMRLRRRLIEELGLETQFELSLLLVSCPRTMHRAPELVDAFERMLRSSPPPVGGYLRQLEYCLEHDAMGRLAEIEAPTLVVTGSDDILTPPHQGTALAEGIPGALYREIDGTSHALIWEAPEVLSELVGAFLAWQDGGGATALAQSLRVSTRPIVAPEPLTIPTGAN